MSWLGLTEVAFLFCTLFGDLHLGRIKVKYLYLSPLINNGSHYSCGGLSLASLLPSLFRLC